MVSTYHLIRLLQNARSSERNRKEIQTKNKDSPPNTNETTLKVSKVMIPTCRICLQDGTHPIFSSTYPIPISLYLKWICDIEVAEDDNCPQHLCQSCLDSLKTAIKFRITAKETQLKLKPLILNSPKYVTIPISYPHGSTTFSMQDKIQDNTIQQEKQISEEQSLPDEVELLAYDPEAVKALKQYLENKEKLNHEKYYKQIVGPNNLLAYQCNICKKLYKKRSLADHIKSHQPDSDSQYICETCGRKFKRFSTLYMHRRTHSTVLQFKCKLCPYKGRYKEQLNGHIKRIHEIKYNYQCPQCPRKFKEKNYFRHHLRRHSEPKFQCESCKRPFYENSELRKHIEMHHMGPTPLHICETCHKPFKRRNNLLAHQIKVHNRKKIFDGRANYIRFDNNSINSKAQNENILK